MSLSARKLKTLRAIPCLGRLFGIGGRPVPLLRNWKSGAVEKDQLTRSSLKQRVFEWVRRKEVYAQDKFAGIAEMAREIEQGEAQYLSPDFLMHVNELTLLVQKAGTTGIAVEPTTSFNSLGRLMGGQGEVDDYCNAVRPGVLENLFLRLRNTR